MVFCFDVDVSVLWVSVVALVLWCIHAPNEQRRALRCLPRPASTLPILRNTVDVLTNMSRLHDWVSDQCQAMEGKTWELDVLGGQPTVVVTSVAVFEDVLNTQFDVFKKGQYMREAFQDLTHNSIIAEDGDEWRRERKILSRLFSMRQFRETISASIEKHMRAFGKVLDTEVGCQHADAERLFDLGGAFHHVEFDKFAEIAFGIDESTRGKEDRNEFVSALAVGFQMVGVRLLQPRFLWKVKRFLNIGSERKLKAAIKTVDDNMYRIIGEAIQHKTDRDTKLEGVNDAKKGRDVVSLIIEHGGMLDNDNSVRPGTVNARYLRDLAHTTITAGSDTSSVALTWFNIMLAQHPLVVQAIRRELKTCLPELFTNREYVPTMNDVDTLVYLEAALRENLRLNTVSPVSMTLANRDTTLCDGTFVKEGTAVYIPGYAAARMTSIWGKDAAKYNPERFLNRDPSNPRKTPTLRTFSPYQFLSFNAGPRICLGMRYAMTDMKITMAHVLSKYEFSPKQAPASFTYAEDIILSVKDPLLVRVSKL